MTFSAEEVRERAAQALGAGPVFDMLEAFADLLEQREAVTDWAVPDDDSCDVNEEGLIFTAGIDVADAKCKVWMNRIECHGYTEKEAHALRNEVMASSHARQVPEWMRSLYEAASKGLHTSGTYGPESRHVHISKFQTMQDLHDYTDAWNKAMTLAAPPATEKD